MRVLIPSISINQINYVIALYKTGSFSKAAKMCSVTQSTLSTMIKKLEDQISMPLFDRKTKPVKLTSEGELLINQFLVINNEYNNLVELVQETNEVFFGTLKIGIIPTLAPFLLPLILPKLLQQYPTLDLKIFETTTHEIVRKLKLRELDVGILSLPINDEALIEMTLFTEDFLVYDTRRKSKNRTKYKIDDIDVSRLWLLEESHCLSNQIGKICHLKKTHSAYSNLMFNSGSLLSLLELVHINKGITLLPRLATLQKHIVNQSFVFPLTKPVPAREIGLVTYSSFIKKSLLAILEDEIIAAVKPLMEKRKSQNIIKPFYDLN